MKRMSVTMLDGQDLRDLELITLLVLDMLLQSTPEFTSFKEYARAIRLRAILKAGKKQAQFILDFPTVMSFDLDSEFGNSKSVTVECINGMDFGNLAEIVFNKVCQLLIVAGVRDINFSSRYSGFDDDTEQTTAWLRLPPLGA